MKYKIIGLLSILVLLMAIGIALTIAHIESAYNIDTHSKLEKIYFIGGILSGVFAGLAFIGVLFSLALQGNDSRMSKKTNYLQRFENTFFNMISLQQEIVNNLRFAYSESTTTLTQRILERGRNDKHFIVIGREVFEHLYLKKLKSNIEEKGLSYYTSINEVSLFDHYFRHLYTIVKFVDSANLSFDERYKYVSMVRATLSSYELCWIYYNELFFPKFKKYIEEYSLLKNIKQDLLAHSKEYKNFISKEENRDRMLKNNFPRNDYEYFMTYSENNIPNHKYFIQAFFNNKELADAISIYKKRERGENVDGKELFIPLEYL